VRYLAKPLQDAVSLAVKYSGLKLFEQHTVSELLWGYQPKFPAVIQYFLTELNMVPIWGIYVGVITSKIYKSFNLHYTYLSYLSVVLLWYAVCIGDVKRYYYYCLSIAMHMHWTEYKIT